MPRSKNQLLLFLLSMFLLSSVGSALASIDVNREPGWETPPRENLRFTVFDLPAGEIEQRLGVPYAEMIERRSGLQVMAPSDTGIALVMLCQWEDDPADTVAHPRAAYDTLLFSLDVVNPGSMRDFWLEDSYGSYWIEGQVYGWFTQPTYSPDMWFTDFFEAADPYIDYSLYDRDGDGYTDAVWIFHAGPGQEETHDPDHIWSYAVFQARHGDLLHAGRQQRPSGGRLVCHGLLRLQHHVLRDAPGPGPSLRVDQGATRFRDPSSVEPVPAADRDPRG
jgi:hypothetical protein